MSAVESACIGRKDPSIAFWQGGGATQNLFEEPICSGFERSTTSHPTPKPISLVAKILKIICPVGGRVLDPFAGSFGTGVAAVLLGMKPTCIDLNSIYFSEGVERVKDAENIFGSYSLDKDGNLTAEKQNKSQYSLFGEIE
jgi:DNA modification methylase